MSGKSWIVTLLASATLLGGCSSAPAPPAPPDLRPAIAAPVKPIDALPKRVTIPSIGVDATVVGIGLNSSNQFELTPLDAKPQEVGWYIYGPPPGTAGPAALMSHVNYNGTPGAFAHLDKVKVGDKIRIARGDGSTLTFTTTRVGTVLKSKFSTLDVFAPTPDAQLRLATCGGEYVPSRRTYLSNIWVWASLDKP